MKALLITSKEEDYLQDSIIHGFKELFGKDAVDYPAKDILYNDYVDLKKIRGNGFTLYGLLSPALKNDAVINMEESIKKKEFELIIFTSIYRQYEIFYKHVQSLLKTKIPVWIMDGEDSPVLFPYLGKHIKRFITAIKPHKHFTYFKRELLPETLNSIYYRLPVSRFAKGAFPDTIKPISFSVPSEKIIKQPIAKTKLFTSQIVDREVALKMNKSSSQKLFKNEVDYYRDLQISKFGITTKRAGWDCLRHYEIAANGAVLCFKDLQDKPESCAPHGLIPGYNCISYCVYDDLIKKIERIPDQKYEQILNASCEWIKNQLTVYRIKELLAAYYINASTSKST